MGLDSHEPECDTESNGAYGYPGIFDPTSEEEQNVLLATLASFYLYRRAAHYTFTHRRRRNFYTLPRAQQQVLQSINFQSALDDLDTCIENNATFAEAMLKSGCNSFGINLAGVEGWKDLADNSDMDKARSTMKQFLRDWSKDGEKEREECYGPILKAIEELFGKAEPRCEVRVLVPGAGLGRLAFEICRRGYATEGNEFSYHQLVASNFVLNNTKKADEFKIHPFCLGFSHHRSRENQSRSITIPDVHPGTVLNTPIEFKMSDPNSPDSPPADYQYRPSQYFSMSAGEFIESYNNADSSETFDCVVTCFFIDTARNLLNYLETIRNVLVDGGVWINNGPLLWHWEGADASEKEKGWEVDNKKSAVKSFEAAEGGVEDAEAPILPPTSSNTERSHTHSHASGDTSHSHGHSHLDPSDFHSHSSQSPSSSTPSTDWKGSLEFTLDEVLQLAKLYGFDIVRQGTCKTGYIEDDRCMAKYVYEPEFWVAIKTPNINDSVKASLRKFPSDEGHTEES